MTKAVAASITEKGADFFLVKFWTHMLQNPECEHVCEWAPDGRHLIIYDPDVLMAEIKTRGVCKQKNYDSFARQLRIYRWGRVKAEDCGVSPLPEQVKVWRHPRLNRDSPLVDVANVTRNAPPKPNKAALAAGLPDQKDPKPRQRATDIYEDGDMDTDERSGSDSSDDSDSNDDSEVEIEHTRPPTASVPLVQPPSTIKPYIASIDNIPSQQTTAFSVQAAQQPSTQVQSASVPPPAQIQQPLPKVVPTPPQPTAAQLLASAMAKLSKAHAKKMQAASRNSPRLPFDVETSIFDPNNNFGVTTARPLSNSNVSSSTTKAGQGNRKYSRDDVSSDSDLTSEGETSRHTLRGKSGSAAPGTSSIPSLSIPQVSQAFLAQVMYDNAAIEHAAHHPANYDRLPWSAPASKPETANMNANFQQRPQTWGNNTLATLESRLQSISASLRAADAAAAQHAR